MNGMFSFSQRFLILLIFSLFLCAQTFASTIARPMNNSGLVGYWNFEEGRGNAYAYDRSGFGNTGILTNGPISTSSNTGLGQAMSFDGSASFVNLGNISTANFASNDFSVSIWFKTSISSGVKYLIGKRNACFHESFWNISVDANSGGVLTAEIDNNNVNYNVVNSIGAVNNGQWHHAVITRSGTVMTVHVDGIFSNSGSTAGITNVSNASNLNFGTGPCSGGFFFGSIDEVRIYNRALNSDEVSRLYRLQKPKVASGVNNVGLFAYWPFEEGAGTRTEDASFSSNTATLVNGATWTTGKNGKAINFDGNNDYLTIGNVGGDSANLTVSAWVYARDLNGITAGINTIISKEDPTGGYVLRVGDSGIDPARVQWVVGDGAQQKLNANAVTGLLALNTWYYIAATYNSSGSQKIYINGVLNAQQSIASGVLAPSVNNLEIGLSAGDTGRVWNGIIDDVRIYYRELSATEIYNLYKGSKASIVGKSKDDRLTNGLVGYWTFDANKLAGASVYDSSISANNGSITNGAVPTIGKVGQALILNGSNQNVSIPDSNSLDFSSSYSVSTWVYGTSYNVASNKWIGIVTKGNTGEAAVNNHNYILGYNNNAGFGAGYRWLFDLEDSAGANCDLLGNAPAATSTWYHLVGVFDNPNDIMSLYVNGELQGQAACTLTPNTNALPVLVGDDAHSSSIPWTGKIDDVRIYNRALSEEEAKALYNMGR